MDDPYPAIVSPRLSLVWLGPALIQGLLNGERDLVARALGVVLPSAAFTADAELRLLALRAGQMARRPEAAPWLLRLIVDRPSREVAGHCGFHGPPRPTGAAELGYTVYEAFRGRGYAQEAARALMDWGKAHGAGSFIASIAPTNAASLAVARRLGFVQTGTQIDDEDGEELVFERPA